VNLHTSLRTRIVAGYTALCFGALCFSTGALAQAAARTPTVAPAPASAPAADEQEGKMIWGLLIKLIAPSVFQFFSEWLVKKIAVKYDEESLQRLAINAAGAAVVSLGDVLKGNLLGGKGTRDIVLMNAPAENATTDPATPLKVDKNGENYQGVHVSLVTVDAQGKPTGFRAVADGFKTGERFKLRVVPTFDAVIVLGNLTPKGVQKQIYPAPNQVVTLQAGKEVLLPLLKNQYFQFAGDIGEDKLTITVREPRSLLADGASSAKVHRKDETYGSNLDRKSTRLNSSHRYISRMPSSA
jgi:hypothetical protein